jgi:hypothetical protein
METSAEEAAPEATTEEAAATEPEPGANEGAAHETTE